MATVVEELGGYLDWNSHPAIAEANLLTSHGSNTQAAYIACKGYDIAEGVAGVLGIPWMELRIQEGALWDYSLHEAETIIDNFSTLPEYWGDPTWLEIQRAKPGVLARSWQIEESKIENYLRPWGYQLDEATGVFETKLRGKAYPADRYEYGEIWQMTDFLRALGVQDPGEGPPHGTPRELTFNVK
jgi:hypothetical protein